MSTPTLYDILGVANTAAPDQIRLQYDILHKRYTALAKKLQGKGQPIYQQKLQELEQAFETLKDSAKRAAYDAQFSKPTVMHPPAPYVPPKTTAPTSRPIGPSVQSVVQKIATQPVPAPVQPKPVKTKSRASEALAAVIVVVVIVGLFIVLGVIQGGARPPYVDPTNTPVTRGAVPRGGGRPVVPTQYAVNNPTSRATEVPTMIPTETEEPPSPTDVPTDAPYVQPTDVPPTVEVVQCTGYLPPRLVAGQNGRVISGGAPNRLREGPGTTYRQIGTINPGEVFSVSGGPNCNGGITWWYVTYQGIQGWTAEGEGNQYYLEPYGSSSSSDQAQSQLAQGGWGLSDGSYMSDGNFQVEGYCNRFGTGARQTRDYWYCGSRRLTVTDFNQICRETYKNDQAFARQDGESSTPAYNWRCYVYTS